MPTPDPVLAWPPTLDMYKLDADVPVPAGAANDPRLEQTLQAAIEHVERLKAGKIDFTGDTLGVLPSPTADMILGTLRLAVRWNARRRSVDGLVNMGQQGIGRMPAWDADIERMIGIGRHEGFGVA